MPTPLINGVAYAWANVTVNIFGVPIIGITQINYKKKRNKTNNYGANSKPVSRGYGNYEYEGSIELYQEELKKIIAASPNRDPLDIPPFDINVTFGGNGVLPTVDKLLAVEFTEEGLAASQGDTSLKITLPLVIADITR